MIRRTWAALWLKCPRCFRGNVYCGLMRMNRGCPVCGLTFEREIGYFFGAMYASWALMIATVFPVVFVLLYAGQDAWAIIAVAAIQTVIEAPLAFMYSRVIWMQIDSYFDPLPAWDGAGR